MYPTHIPVKTVKGLQEVASRRYELPPAMRRVLIMVNGQYTLEELTKKLVGFGDIDSILMHLEVDGFIAPLPDKKGAAISQRPISQRSVSQRPLPQLPVSQRPSTPSSALPEFNMDKAKGFIRFILFAAMGPTAERRINRIDATTTPEALRLELDDLHDLLPKALSKKEAQRVWQQLEPIMASIRLLE